MDVREKLEANLARTRQIIDAGLDAGITDSLVMRAAARLLGEYKETLRMLESEDPEVLDLLEKRAG